MVVVGWCRDSRTKVLFRNTGVISGSLSVFQPVCLSVCLSVCMFNCLFVCLFVCLPICLSACLSVCLSVCLFACLPVCLSVCLSDCLSVCLSVCLSDCMLFSCLTWLCVYPKGFRNFDIPSSGVLLNRWFRHCLGHCNFQLQRWRHR